MAQKWTQAQHRKFKATMAAKHEPKIRTIEERRNGSLIKMGPVEEWRNSPAELPVVEVNSHGGNGYDAEFAAAFAAAWKVYKGL